MSTAHIPLRHLSVRVPWHDAGWDGTVCRAPRANASCLVLNRIGSSKRDDIEERHRGARLDDLPEDELPPCFAERVNFLSTTPQRRRAHHAYAKTSDDHKHIEPTVFAHPAFSAAATPFRWLLKAQAWGEKWKKGEIARGSLVDRYGIEAVPEQEPEEPGWLQERPWIQGHANQKALLDGFFGAIKEKKSLVFVYAKQTPLVDDQRIQLIGVGQVSSLGELQEYEYSTKKPVLRSFLWERSVGHSIRKGGDESVLLPYHELLAACEKDPSLDPSSCIAFVPDEYRAEFSYGSEHVSSATAISMLLRIKQALVGYQQRFLGNFSAQLTWIDRRLGELWQLRGPYPGMGSVLCAAGVVHGYQLAHHCWEEAGENCDPWPVLDAVVREPKRLPADLREQAAGFAEMWRFLASKKGESRLALAKLLARVDVTLEQASRWWDPAQRDEAGLRSCVGEPITDPELLANPYLLFECDRLQPGPMAFSAVDQGAFPEKAIATKFPLPDVSKMRGPTDSRRFRAALADELERASAEGHALLPRSMLVQRLSDRPLTPILPVTLDLFDVHGEALAPLVTNCVLADGKPAHQLDRLSTARDVIRGTIEKRLTARRHDVSVDWRVALDREFKDKAAPGSEEDLARAEKAAALAELAAARFATLVGPAGTGKTTLLKLLCQAPAIKDRGVLLLAPTGKARVRLQDKTGLAAFTLAQFLRPRRYRDKTGHYVVLGNVERCGSYKTVIVDESSMLTEEQLAALIDSLNSIDRLILVGDPGQLPPIGAGRPFVDIIARVKPDAVSTAAIRVAPSYAELTVTRRQADGSERRDLQLAQWFSGRAVGPGDDDILISLGAGGNIGPNLRVCAWSSPAALAELLPKVISEELGIDPKQIEASFAVKALGATADEKGNAYFNRHGRGTAADQWQILTPLRGQAVGTTMLNRLVQQEFRGEARKRADREDRRFAKIPRPMGTEGIIYGDKIINVANHPRTRVFPDKGPAGQEPLCYIANGEIGIVTGPFKRAGSKISLNMLNVTFSTQPDFEYTFWPSELSEEDSYLELAYALSVHKAQGSEFKTVFVVVPNPCRLLSRELLYTAMTRQLTRLVLLCQGEPLRLIDYRHQSETARRLTNLFHEPQPVLVKKTVFDKWHIHHSRRGELMISKSEVLIANELDTAGMAYDYELPLTGHNGKVRYPDFTIADADTGETWYWEHLGMLSDAGYRERWKTKLAWYRASGIKPHAEGGGPNGILVTTEEKAGFSTLQVQQMIRLIKGT